MAVRKLAQGANKRQKRGLKKGSFCFMSPLSQNKPFRISRLSDKRSIAVGRNKTKTIPVSFVPDLSLPLRSSIGSNITSTFFLTHTFTGFWQWGHRVTNTASELKTASRKIIFVQWGQLPTLDSSLSILFFICGFFEP